MQEYFASNVLVLLWRGSLLKFEMNIEQVAVGINLLNVFYKMANTVCIINFKIGLFFSKESQ